MNVAQANRQGMLWAGVSALSYATMNVFLRYVALDTDPFFAAFMRTVPVTIYSWAMVLRSYQHGSDKSGGNLLPPRQFWLTLVVVGIASNVTGNAAFQVSLTLGGLVLAVPITQGAML